MSEEVKKSPEMERIAVLEGKIDKLLIINLELVRSHAEFVEQQQEIIEKLSNVTLGGDGFSYGEA